MGIYIQQMDIDCPLYDWLIQNGQTVSLKTIERFVYDPDPLATLPVCWIDNGGFQAAVIAFNYQELTRFLHGICDRPHQWFIVPKDLLRPWLPKQKEREE